MKLRKPQLERQKRTATVELVSDQKLDSAPFDYRTAINEQDFQGMMECLQGFAQAVSWESYNIMLGHMLLMYPEQREQLVEEKMAELYKINIGDCNEDEDLQGYTSLVWDFVSAFPERRGELDIPDDLFDRLKNKMDQAADVGDRIVMGLLASRLFPERRDEIQLGAQHIERINQDIRTAIEKGYQSPLLMAALAIMYCPSIKDQLQIDEKELAAYREKVEGKHGSNWYAYIHDAFIFPYFRLMKYAMLKMVTS